LDEAVNDIVV